MIVVITGVAGSGKTLIGRMLARELGWEFFDADDFHDPVNIARMASGQPLDEQQRAPWLLQLKALVQRLDESGTDAVLACSALRRSFRDELRRGVDGIHFIRLDADDETILERLRMRKDHFAGEDLLPSQLTTLEPGEDSLTIRNEAAPQQTVATIRRRLHI